MQWTEELNELGAPLFLKDDGEALIRLESYVDRYPEIAELIRTRASRSPIDSSTPSQASSRTALSGTTSPNPVADRCSRA